MTMSDERNVDEMSFEEAIKELEGLVKVLEKGELDLETSLKVYGRATVLKERCKKILDDSERKVQSIIDGGEIADFQ